MEQVNGIAVAFAHFASIKPGYGGNIVINLRFRDHKHFAILIIVFDSDVTSDFQMLFLVLADRNHIAADDEDVRRHEFGDEFVGERQRAALRA